MTSDKAKILQMLQGSDTEARSIPANALTLQQWVELAYNIRSEFIKTTIPSYVAFARIQCIVCGGGVVNAEQFLNIVEAYTP